MINLAIEFLFFQRDLLSLSHHWIYLLNSLTAYKTWKQAHIKKSSTHPPPTPFKKKKPKQKWRLARKSFFPYFCDYWFWCLCPNKYLYFQSINSGIHVLYQIDSCCTWEQVADGGVGREVEVLPQITFDQHQGDDSLQDVPCDRGQIEATRSETPNLFPLEGIH